MNRLSQCRQEGINGPRFIKLLCDIGALQDQRGRGVTNRKRGESRLHRRERTKVSR